jgi:hypothetical protein
MSQGRSIFWVGTAFKYSLIFILAYSYFFLGSELEIFPKTFFVDLSLDPRAVFYEGYVRYNLNNISSLFFLVPFYLHYYLLRLNQSKSELIDFLIIIFSFVLCILTGRKGLILVVILTPVLISLVELFYDTKLSVIEIFKKNTYISIFIFIIIFISIISFFKIDNLIEYIISGFDFRGTDNVDAMVRGEQFTALIDGWINGNFIIGAGNGSNVDYIRSEEQPWAYELSYVYMLFSVGVFGMLFYISWFITGLFLLKNEILNHKTKDSMVMPIITGIIGLLIGNISNPYIMKFDYLWIIFLPFFLAGSLKFQKNQ